MERNVLRATPGNVVGAGITVQREGIAENAARNYSKKVYAKMGIAGQTELVRTLLRCLSFLR